MADNQTVVQADHGQPTFPEQKQSLGAYIVSTIIGGLLGGLYLLGVINIIIFNTLVNPDPDDPLWVAGLVSGILAIFLATPSAVLLLVAGRFSQEPVWAKIIRRTILWPTTAIAVPSILVLILLFLYAYPYIYIREFFFLI